MLIQILNVGPHDLLPTPPCDPDAVRMTTGDIRSVQESNRQRFFADVYAGLKAVHQETKVELHALPGTVVLVEGRGTPICFEDGESGRGAGKPVDRRVIVRVTLEGTVENRLLEGDADARNVLRPLVYAVQSSLRKINGEIRSVTGHLVRIPEKEMLTLGPPKPTA